MRLSSALGFLAITGLAMWVFAPDAGRMLGSLKPTPTNPPPAAATRLLLGAAEARLRHTEKTLEMAEVILQRTHTLSERQELAARVDALQAEVAARREQVHQAATADRQARAREEADAQAQRQAEIDRQKREQESRERHRLANPVLASAAKLAALSTRIEAIEKALPALTRDRDQTAAAYSQVGYNREDTFHDKLRADEAQAIHDMAAKELDDLRAAHRQALRDDAAVRAASRREAMKEWLDDPRGGTP